MKIEKLPIYILLMFTAVYMMFGNKTPIWSGLYFVANYLILILLFAEQKDKHVRILGVSISATILIFSVFKFFLSVDQEILKSANIIIFILLAAGLYKLEPK